MPVFDIAFFRHTPDHTGFDAMHLTVDWSCLPREGEGVDIADGLDAQTVESVGYDLDGHPTVDVGRIVLDDLQVQHLLKAGWRIPRIPDVRAGGRAR